MKKIALGIEYNGKNYRGWQRQEDVNSVQKSLEFALSKIANHDVEVVSAGRTDAGVHATNQVVHFEAKHDRISTAWVQGVNTFLPDDIRVIWSKTVSDEFNARYSAVARSYCYILHQSNIDTALANPFVTKYFKNLDVDRMQKAAQYLIGEQDFSSFQASSCQSKSSSRNVIHAYFERKGNLVIFHIKANAFLHHMVRNIVGSLLLVGVKEKEVDWMKSLIQEKDRTKAGMTAKPNGLYLAGVEYPEKYNLPNQVKLPWFL